MEIEPMGALLTMLQKHRPCPQCGSERVTTRREGQTLRVACSDCGFAREARVP